MKIFETLLDAEGFETFVALTYGCDLPWFERMLARPLRAQGVRRFLLLADHRQLSLAVETQLELIRGAGRWYSVEGIQAAGSFHPKVYLLTGPDRARLWIGSGNLRATGIGRNREVFEQWDVKTTDGAVPAVFEQLRGYIDRILGELMGAVPLHVVDALTDAFGVRVLAQPPSIQDARVLGSPTALSTQLSVPQTPATRLRMVAPFFDDEGSLAVRLADHFRAPSFDVITDVAVTTLSPRAVATIRNRGGRVMSSPDSRPLHAKLLHAEGDGWSLSVHGSANLTNRAWHGSNAELVVIREGDGSAAVGTLIDELATLPLSDADEELLELRAVQRAKNEASNKANEPSPTLGIESARWLDERNISIVTRQDAGLATGVDVAVGGSVSSAPPSRTNSTTVRITIPIPTDPSAPVAVRLRIGDSLGAWAFVHHFEELAEWSKSTSRNEQRLMPLLLANPDDSDLALLYVELCRRVLVDRAERSSASDDEEQQGAGRREPKWTFVRDEDFLDATERERKKRNTTAEAIDPARLLRRVLFGSDDADDDGERGTDTERGSSEDSAGTDKKPLSRERRLAFAAAVEKSRVEYLDGLRQDSKRGAERLLEDLQLLMIGAHRGLRVAALTPREFLASCVPTLRAFIGTRNGALVVALRTERDALTDQTWRGWCASTVLLLMYNACLAQLEVAPSDDDTLDPAFPDVGPVFWMRNLVSAMDLKSDDATLDQLNRQISRLRRLGLWLGDLWPYHTKRVPLEVFIRRMIGDTEAIEHASRRLPVPVPRLSAGNEDDDVHVVGLGRDGQIAVGFQEGGIAVACLRDGAFQREANPEAPWERMHRTGQACPLDRLLGDSVDEKVFEGLDLLRHLV